MLVIILKKVSLQDQMLAMEGVKGSSAARGKGRGARFLHLYQRREEEASRAITEAIRAVHSTHHTLAFTKWTVKEAEGIEVDDQETQKNKHSKPKTSALTLKVFICPNCGESFMDKATFTKHMKSFHDQVTEDLDKYSYSSKGSQEEVSENVDKTKEELAETVEESVDEIHFRLESGNQNLTAASVI